MERVNTQAGRQVSDAMWRQQVRMAIGRASGKQWLEADFDFKKAFEHVSRPRLVEVAARHGYPMRYLATSLRAYASERRLLVDWLASKPMWAKRNIGAGSAWAT